MALELTNETWTQIRHDYEHTDRPVEDICAEHGISSGTLRNRVRRWGWTRRRPPVPRDGPPPAPAPQIDAAAPPLAATPLTGIASPQAAAGFDAGEPDDGTIVPRLQRAVARVLPAIEATVARLAAEPMHPREIERTGRALAALTRTLRELNGLLSQLPAAGDRAACACDDYDMPEDIDAFRFELARRIRAFVEARRPDLCGTEPEGP